MFNSNDEEREAIQTLLVTYLKESNSFARGVAYMHLMMTYHSENEVTGDAANAADLIPAEQLAPIFEDRDRGLMSKLKSNLGNLKLERRIDSVLALKMTHKLNQNA